MSITFCPECASQRLKRTGFTGTSATIVVCSDCGTKHEIKEVIEEPAGE